MPDHDRRDQFADVFDVRPKPKPEPTLDEQIEILRDNDIAPLEKISRIGYSEEFFYDHVGPHNDHRAEEIAEEYVEELLDELTAERETGPKTRTEAVSGGGAGRRALPNVHVSTEPDDTQPSIA